MKRKLFGLFGMALGLSVLSTCGGFPGSGNGLPSVKRAQSLSAHYVLVEFEGSVDQRAADASKYQIIDTHGAQLAVTTAVLSDDMSEVLLTTMEQEDVGYDLLLGDAGTGCTTGSDADTCPVSIEIGVGGSVDLDVGAGTDWRESAFLQAGEAARLKGTFSRAVDYYEQAIAMNPHRMEAYMGLSRTYESLNDYYQARIALRQALDIDPMHEGVLILWERYQER